MRDDESQGIVDARDKEAPRAVMPGGFRHE